MGWLSRCFGGLFLFAGIPYLAIVAFFGVAQRSLIYQPTRIRSLNANSLSEVAARVSDVEISAENNLKLHGWHFTSLDASNETRRFLVIYFPGNGRCRASRVPDCCDFTAVGCDVVLFDYRGYGDNDGSPTETLLAADAERVWTFAKDTLRYPADRILIFGESLGGGVATRLAADLCTSGEIPAGLILNSTFASLAETGAWHYPALPVQLLLRDRFSSLTRIPQVKCPILQFHGTADEVVPYKHGQRLFAAAPARSSNGIEKEFVTIPDGTHNLIRVADIKAVLTKLLKRIEQLSKVEDK